MKKCESSARLFLASSGLFLFVAACKPQTTMSIVKGNGGAFTLEIVRNTVLMSVIDAKASVPQKSAATVKPATTQASNQEIFSDQTSSGVGAVPAGESSQSAPASEQQNSESTTLEGILDNIVLANSDKLDAKQSSADVPDGGNEQADAGALKLDSQNNAAQTATCVVSAKTVLALTEAPQKMNRYFRVKLKTPLKGCAVVDGYIAADDARLNVAEASANENASAEKATSYMFPMDKWVSICEEAGAGVGAFGSWRSGGSRKHAGCDLYAPVGTKIYAVEDGVVQDSYLFYCSTDALEVKGSRTIRYGEIRSGSPAKYNVRPGTTVKKGQVIAEVGLLDCYYQPMLHFELYSGSASGPLTAGGIFQRRSDLQNPTEGLRSWRSKRFAK